MSSKLEFGEVFDGFELTPGIRRGMKRVADVVNGRFNCIIVSDEHPLPIVRKRDQLIAWVYCMANAGSVDQHPGASVLLLRFANMLIDAASGAHPLLKNVWRSQKFAVLIWRC